MPSTPSRLAPLDDAGAALQMLAEVTGLETREVERRLRAEQRRLGANVAADLAAMNVLPFVWSDGLLRFYRETNAFLFESLIWNRQPTKQKLRNWILQQLGQPSPAPLRVLAYGDGLGFDSAAVALAGHAVTYFEVGEKSRRFAERVFARNCVAVQVVQDEAELQIESFDAILCLDVLEHVPDPPVVVRRLAELLAPNGRLFVSAPFWYLHPDVPTHLRSNLRYCGNLREMFAPAGLHAIDAAPFWTPLMLQKCAAGQRPRVSLAAQARIRLAQMALIIGRWRPQLLCRIYNPIARRHLRATTNWLPPLLNPDI